VGAATEFAYEVIADGHTMTLIALDGYDIQPLSADSFIILPGESIDFLLVPDPDTVQSGRYWLRARTLGKNVTHEVKGILAYDNETGTDPTSSERCCIAEKPCRIFNCPYFTYPKQFNRTCVPLTDARSAFAPDWLDTQFGVTSSEYVEYFLNFAHPLGPMSINAVEFSMPRALLRPKQFDSDPHVVPCPDAIECQTNRCECTYIKELPFNTTIQVCAPREPWHSSGIRRFLVKKTYQISES